MSDVPNSAVPKWFRIFALVAILWNLIGCFMWCMELFAQESMMEAMTDPQKEWVRSIPSWLYGVYFAAVTTGVLGSVGLLMRKNWAVPVLAVSLALVLVQMLYPTLVAGGLQAMGPGSLTMPVVVITLAVALLWLASYAKAKTWLDN